MGGNKIAMNTMQRLVLSRLLCLVSISYIALPVVVHAQPVTATWTGETGNGSYTTAANWDVGMVPDKTGPTTYDIVIGSPGPTALDFPLIDIDTLTLDSAGRLDLFGGTNMLISGGALTNDGVLTINLDSTIATHLTFPNSAALAGEGTILLNGAPDTALVNVESGVTLTHGADHTIRGAGVVVVANSGLLINQGLIEARAQPNSTTLQIFGEIEQNAATGRIVANNATVELISGTTISGGRLQSVGLGTVEQDGFVTLRDVTNEAVYHVADGATTIENSDGLASDFINHGAIVLSESASIEFSNPGTLSGNGSLTISGTEFETSVVGYGGLMHRPNHTIRGSGELQMINGDLVNDGAIEATRRPELPSGGSILTIDAPSITNNNLLQANEEARLVIPTNVTQDDLNGRIVANGGVVELGSVGTGVRQIVGGRLQTIGPDGVFEQTDDVGLISVTNESAYHVVVPGRTLFVGDTDQSDLTNTGLITFDAAATNMRFDGPGTLAGTGTVVLNGTRLFRSGPPTPLTHGADHTIRGSGLISIAAPGTSFINDGEVHATWELDQFPGPGSVPAGTLRLAVFDLANNNLLQADEGATLEFFGGAVTQDDLNGRIVANDGTVAFNGSNTAIVGGRLESVGSGTIEQTSNVTLTDVINAAIYNADDGHLTVGENESLESHLTNDGTLNVSRFASVEFLQDATLDGSGSLALEATDMNVDDELTHGANHTIRGAGSFFTGDLLTNEGVIEATLLPDMLPNDAVLDMFGDDVSNNNMLRANEDATLKLNGLAVTQDNVTGRIVANGGIVELDGSIISGGRLESTGLGSVQVSGNPTLAGVTSEATIRGTGTINGDFVNLGRVEGETGSMLILAGRVSGDGTLRNVGIAVTGTHAPGQSTASVPLEGVYALAGALEIEIGGTAAGTEYDQLVSTGIVDLLGGLKVSLIDIGEGEFAPSAGDLFTIITAELGVQGTFSVQLLPELDPLLDWWTLYRPDSVKLVVAPALPGDYNVNGVVDAADYAVWRDTLGSTTSLVADGNHDGSVDEDDFQLWRSTFGNFLNGSGSASDSSTTPATVPEPTTITLVFMVLVVWNCSCSGRRRRQRV